MNNVERVQSACDSGDLKLLDELLTPTKRLINKSLDFRSPLMISAHNLKHLQKISTLESDSIMLNLEDGVSHEQKPFALRLCALTLSHFQKIDKKLIVRVNELENGALEEIKFLNTFMPDAIRVPKIRNSEDVKRVLEVLDENIELHLSIETKEAWLNLKSLRVDERVKVFYLGILDLFADLNLSQSLITPQSQLMHYMLSHFMITCRCVGVKPVSFVFQDHKDSATFQEWLNLEKSMGYDAKGCISPTQAITVQNFFGIDSAEIERAKEIVKLFEDSQKNGVSGFDHKIYGFIDEPIYKGALKILNKVVI
jgi:citrate lyase subunit beta / citryl-CoA lyase